MFRLYTLLVAIEIALKNRLPTFEHGHDLTILTPKVIPAMPSGLQAQLTALDAALKVLICTYKGIGATINPAQYPGVRYLRLQKDGFSPAATDAQVSQALNDANAFVAELNREGVSV